MSHEDIIGRLLELNWGVVDVRLSAIELLTSDRPVVIDNDQQSGDTSFVLPVGPEKLFIATTSKSLHDRLRSADNKKLVEAVNRKIFGCASQYVFARTERQMRFIENRFGSESEPSLAEKILRDANLMADNFHSMLPPIDPTEYRQKIVEAIARHEATALST
ncbi:DUF4238 domain-containing protein [Rhizobium sp. BE258]|jgi:hypothetical protein|uniref:DUF4238 domain-containing protein n=1 Tax=Rhizobium sp. BE258 TaxID=2817722 RepID=UPI002858BE26|nr:DUF4238 domain-containing protein [Rhizobium sp. BE258]MDR7141837.1 hypothetical protein [Rhizobium sp. BE258]